MKTLPLAGLRTHVLKCAHEANSETHGMPEDLYEVSGMSSRRNRNLLNLLTDIDPCHYLEVGMWMGSTMLSAAYGPRRAGSRRFVGIDNYSQFDQDGEVRRSLHENLSTHLPTDTVEVIENDCWDIDPAALGTFNVFNYDGNHERGAHKKALTHFKPCLARNFIYICDDWNQLKVRQGTMDGFNAARMSVFAGVELFTPERRNACTDDWWNGTYVAVVTH